MKLSLDLKTSLSQTLTPQQIQYLKLLQLPLVQLEQQVRQEIEMNPMLEEFDPNSDFEYAPETNQDFIRETPTVEKPESSDAPFESYNEPPSASIDDQADPFEFYKLVWQDDSDTPSKGKGSHDDDDFEPFQIKDSVSFLEELSAQLRLLNLSDEDIELAEQILGNIDSDGYLRRDLIEIVDETNAGIEELNLKIKEQINREIALKNSDEGKNPAKKFAISSEAQKIVASYADLDYVEEVEEDYESRFLKKVNLSDAERVLAVIRKLDPPGIGSRSIQECLISQCEGLPKKNAAQKLALEILKYAYDAFAMKHYQALIKQFEVTEEYMREALEFIRKLNPKPGGFDFTHEHNTVIPDFTVEKDKETGELTVIVNDSRLPALKVNSAYEKIKKESKHKMFNKDTRDWIRNKYDDAKFLIQAIRQRKSTMLKVMTAIAFLQKEFFDYGATSLRPLIYKDVSENTGLDISTVCRIVNGKYVQTEFGTYELKFFFSESLPNEDGEEVSTRVIKQIIKDIIESESKDKPYSDDKISDELKAKGYIVARRTVAKYREQLKIPVARLRKEL
jgi:RNA polymerase sigma-54 factor